VSDTQATPFDSTEVAGVATAETDAVESLRLPAATGRPPIVSWLSVDGFGALAGLELSELSPGLNVILGHNEAGKSTLFDFITGVLFGFPRQKADERFHLPVNGGRHGGRIGITDPEGATVIVERHGAPQKQLKITLPDGTVGEEGDLFHLLGGASRDLFGTVFAVDLDDLRRIDGLASDQVREVLFSSSVVGQRRSASAALQLLEAERESLVKPRQGARANQLASELRDARKDLAEARARATGFACLTAEAATREADVDSLRRQLGTARNEIHDLELLQRCWEAILTRRDAVRDLEELGPESDEERSVLDARAAITDLRVGLSGHAERVAQRADARAQHAGLVQSAAKRTAQLGIWAEAVADNAAVDLEQVRREFAGQVETVSKAVFRRDAAAAALSRAQMDAELLERGDLRLAVLREEAAVPARAEIEQRLSSLKHLLRLVMDAESLEREVEHDIERQRTRDATQTGPATPPSAAGALAALFAAAVALVAGGVLVARGQAALGVVVVVAAVIAAVVAGAGLVRDRRRARPSGTAEPAPDEQAAGELAADEQAAPDPAADRRIRLGELRVRIGELAAELGAPPPVLPATVQHLIDEAETLAARRRSIDEQLRLRSEEAARIRAASADLEEAEAALAAARSAVAASAESSGFAPSEDPSALLGLVSEVAALRERREGLRRIEADSGVPDGEIRAYDRRLAELADHLGLPLVDAAENEPADLAVIERWLAEAERRLAAAQRRREQRSDLERTVTTIDQEMDRQLGEGARAEALRADLASGRILDWQANASALAEQIDQLGLEYDAAVRDHERMLNELRQILHTDEIAVLEARCEELEAELDAALRRFLVVSGARLLVNRTLRKHEQERQPAVLERAGTHFEHATHGKYVRVLVESAADGSSPAMYVVQRNGARLDAAVLSRGTVEQLYLCLRLALAESFAERSVPLPIVLDDVLVNFDPVRTAALAATIAETAERHQVIALTCHPHLAELLSRQQVSTGTRVIELSS
jgi:uncharacterized protein YhaN